MSKKSGEYNSLHRRSELQSLEEIVQLADKAGMEYARAKKEADRLELLKASKRAQTMERYDDGKHSETKLRRLAELDREYVAFLEKLSESKGEADKLRIRYESYKNLFEARRSMLSYRKAEMSLL